MGTRLALALLLSAPIWSTFPTLAPAAETAPARPATWTLSSLKKDAARLSAKKDHAGVTKLLWAHVEKLDGEGFLLLIRAHEARKEWGDVIRAANLLVAKKNKNPKDLSTVEALTAIGKAHFMRGKITEAKDVLKQALDLNKSYEPAYHVYAMIYEKMPYEQRLLYQDMVETFGPKPAYLTKLCAINVNDGENEQGKQLCTQAITADQSIAENHVYLGIIAKQKGEPEQAKKLLRAAADIFPASEFAQYEYAAFLEDDKNFVDAFKYYDRCVTASTSSERCQMGLGRTGVQIRKHERVIEAFRAACRMAGRKNAAQVRRAVQAIRQQKEPEWADKLETVAERCSYQ